ncbi:hypothetical protein C7M84_002719 [Penaeus vannamei]|uniref:Uncharacterized protein n=1 Tax=Penaeus vannamei TaxID=6689 RepID=A0A423TQ63_PENVA|nr:hypothetical protein C7M84_002719 [Penaeus vannamei]
MAPRGSMVTGFLMLTMVCCCLGTDSPKPVGERGVSGAILGSANSTQERLSIADTRDDTDDWHERVLGDGSTKKFDVDDKRLEKGPEELPTPESLAWVDPATLANQGYSVENVPSLANLMGLRVVKYRNHQPIPSRLGTSPSAYTPVRYRPRPSVQYSKFNRPVGSDLGYKRTDSKSLTYDNNLFGDSFHNSFHSYYKEENDTLPYSNSHGPPQGINSWRRSHPSSSESRYPSSSPTNGRPSQPPFPSGGAGGGLLDMLDPLNLFKGSQGPVPPRHSNPVPPPGYDPRRPRPQPRPPPSNSRSETGSSPGVKYEVVVDKDQGNRGYQFREDSPLRDDLYIGMDGNIYIKDNSVNDADGSYGDDPFEENSRPRHTSGHQRPYRPRSRPDRVRPKFPRKQIEDEDTFDENEYRELLKNHNLDDYSSREPPASIQNFLPENNPNYKSNSQQNPRGQQTGRYPNYDRRPSRQNRYPDTRYFDWFTPVRGRINYPSFFTDPRQVRLPGFRYPPRHRRLPVPPRAGTPVIPPNVRHSRPTQRPDLTQRRPSSNPAQSRPNFPFDRPQSDPASNHNTRLRGSTLSGDSRGKPGGTKGFYPGNGFFDADFPTLFHMVPSNRHRVYEPLPRPLALNTTTIEEE